MHFSTTVNLSSDPEYMTQQQKLAQDARCTKH